MCARRLRLHEGYPPSSSADLRFEVRGSYLVVASLLLYPTRTVSRLRHPILSDRYFFVTVRLLEERPPLVDADFHWLAVACRRARILHPFFVTAWVFLSDHLHTTCAPTYR